MNNIMVDIETLGISPNSAIINISAVKFQFATDATEIFSQNIDVKSCRKIGLIVDPDTVRWWKEQPPDNVRAMFQNTVALTDALTALGEFAGNPRDLVWWCNGANFDFPILEWAYKATEIPVPWRYYNLRDVRTAYAIFGLDFKSYPRIGNYHNGLDDCLTQIKALKQVLS